MHRSRDIKSYFTSGINDNTADTHCIFNDLAQTPLAEQKPGKRVWPFPPPQKADLNTPASIIDLLSSPNSPTNSKGSHHSSQGQAARSQTSSDPRTPKRRYPRVGPTATSTQSPKAVEHLHPTADQGATTNYGASSSPERFHGIAMSFGGTWRSSGALVVPNSDDEDQEAEMGLGSSYDSNNNKVKDTHAEVLHSDGRNNANASFGQEGSNCLGRERSGSASSLSSLSSSPSLEDIDQLFAQKQPVSTSSPSSSPATTEGKHGRRPNRSSHATFSLGPDSSRRKSEMNATPRFNISLDSLLARHNRDLEYEAIVVQAQELISTTSRDSFEFSRSYEDGIIATKPGQGILAVVLDDVEDEGEAERVRQAAERMGALEHETTFHFFEPGGVDPRARKTFPISSLSAAGWLEMLKDSACREHAFTSGFVQDAMRGHKLPNEVLLWLSDELIYEGRPHLRYAYMRALQVSEELLSSDRLASLLSALGACSSATAVDMEILPVRRATGCARRCPPAAVWSIVEMLLLSSPSLSMSAREYAVKILLRMMIDMDLRSDSSLQALIQDAIRATIDDMPEHAADGLLRSISASIASTIQDSTLRIHILNAIPSVTSRLHNFRRVLALLFSSSSDLGSLGAPSSGADLIALALRRLSHPSFKITTHTDYDSLAALATFLDVILDSGHPGTSTEGEEEEKLFNDGIDALVTQLRILASRIVDSGPGHPKRTECRVVLDRLVCRLEFAVRTQVRLRNNLFDTPSATCISNASVSFMDRFLKHKAPGAELKVI